MSELVSMAEFMAGDVDTTEVSDSIKIRIISYVEETGNVGDAAMIAGITKEQLDAAMVADKDFAFLVRQGEAKLRHKLRKRVYDLAFEDKEIFALGGPDKDEKILVETRANEKMIELAAKMSLADDLTQKITQTSISANFNYDNLQGMDLSHLDRKERSTLRKFLYRLKGVDPKEREDLVAEYSQVGYSPTDDT